MSHIVPLPSPTLLNRYHGSAQTTKMFHLGHMLKEVEQENINDINVMPLGTLGTLIFKVARKRGGSAKTPSFNYILY
jgi:hypothetical protein